MVEWTGEKPAYRQVADDLCQRIAAGEFTSDGQLPSLTRLQGQYKATQTVVRAAVNHLRTAGLVVSHQGKAAFLTPEASNRAAALTPTREVEQLRREVADLRSELTALTVRVAELESD